VQHTRARGADLRGARGGRLAVAGKLTDDGKAHLRTVSLVLPQQKFLEMLADRGGEIPWDWSKVNPQAKAMCADLINKGLILDREYLLHAGQARGALYLRLTDEGRSVVDQIKAMIIAPAPAPEAPTA